VDDEVVLDLLVVVAATVVVGRAVVVARAVVAGTTRAVVGVVRTVVAGPVVGVVVDETSGSVPESLSRAALTRNTMRRITTTTATSPRAMAQLFLGGTGGG
jgi:hypothetical protein